MVFEIEMQNAETRIFFLKIRHLGIRTNFTGQDGSRLIYSFKILSQAKPIIALRQIILKFLTVSFKQLISNFLNKVKSLAF